MKQKPRFVQAIQEARERLGWSQIELSRQMGMGQSWATAIEAGQRGIDIDTLPNLAMKLGLDARSFIKSYLYSRHAGVYASLFPEDQFELGICEAGPGSGVHDVAFRLASLPRQFRSPIEALVLSLHDTVLRR